MSGMTIQQNVNPIEPFFPLNISNLNTKITDLFL